MAPELVKCDRERTEEVVGRIIRERDNPVSSIYREKTLLPEAEFVARVESLGEENGDGALAITAVFLATMFDLGGRSRTLFKRIADPERMKEYQWLFDPCKVVKAGEKMTEQACRDYFGPGGYNIYQSAPQYHHNCLFLVQRYGSDIRNFFGAFGDDAGRIEKELVVKPRARGKEGFRRYGPKVAPLAIERMAQWNLYPLKGVELIDVPVDIHKARILIRTWSLILKGGEVNAHWVTKAARENLRVLCEEKGWSPNNVSEAMYVLGSTLCTYGRHEECPIKDWCKIRKASNLFDGKGKFRQLSD